MIDRQLLDILACPETRESVLLADETFIDRINRRIEAGEMVNRAGEKVSERVNGGLIRRDRRYMYVIRDDIPVMLIEQAIPLEGLVDER